MEINSINAELVITKKKSPVLASSVSPLESLVQDSFCLRANSEREQGITRTRRGETTTTTENLQQHYSISLQSHSQHSNQDLYHEEALSLLLTYLC